MMEGLFDADGKLVKSDQRPADADTLPIISSLPGENIPAHVTVRLLDGNWYGYGPEIVLWDALNELHVSFPVSQRTPRNMNHWVKCLGKAAKKKARGVPPRDGGYYV